MAERKQTPDLMGEVLGAKQRTATTQAAEVDTGDTVTMSLRLPRAWRDKLRAHFKSRGVDLSNGIRYALSEYMEREGLS